MSRSRLYPYRDDIAEALDAGTSIRSLARTYGCHLSTMQMFIGKWLPDRASTAMIRSARSDIHNASRARRYADDPAYRLAQAQNNALAYAQRAADLSRQRAEEF